MQALLDSWPPILLSCAYVLLPYSPNFHEQINEWQYQGASSVYVVDRVPERLTKAKEIGCIPIDFSAGDAVDQILALRGGAEVDRGVDGALCFSFPYVV